MTAETFAVGCKEKHCAAEVGSLIPIGDTEILLGG